MKEIKIYIKRNDKIYFVVTEENKVIRKVLVDTTEKEPEIFVPLKQMVTHDGRVIPIKEEKEYFKEVVEKIKEPEKIKEELDGKEVIYLARTIKVEDREGFIGIGGKVNVSI